MTISNDNVRNSIESIRVIKLSTKYKITIRKSTAEYKRSMACVLFTLRLHIVVLSPLLTWLLHLYHLGTQVSQYHTSKGTSKNPGGEDAQVTNSDPSSRPQNKGLKVQPDETPLYGLCHILSQIHQNPPPPPPPVTPLLLGSGPQVI